MRRLCTVIETSSRSIEERQRVRLILEVLRLTVTREQRLAEGGPPHVLPQRLCLGGEAEVAPESEAGRLAPPVCDAVACEDRRELGGRVEHRPPRVAGHVVDAEAGHLPWPAAAEPDLHRARLAVCGMGHADGIREGPLPQGMAAHAHKVVVGQEEVAHAVGRDLADLVCEVVGVEGHINQDRRPPSHHQVSPRPQAGGSHRSPEPRASWNAEDLGNPCCHKRSG
mmetsp:Transcript_54352/g.168276  ORF Transcript_54352/g.168276 Transcript_54352/m.168276 type:complete len:225 (-) Transcript_54352:58-732(-)